MTDLNLDGLPALFELQRSLSERGNMQLQHELRQLVERERLEASEDAEAESKERWELFQRTSKAKWRLQEELDKERERLPAWAKPVMGAALDWVAYDRGPAASDTLEHECKRLTEAQKRLTEAQLKEIGEDQRALDTLDELSAYTAGWDGYTAPPFPDGVLEIARALAEKFDDVDVAPCPDGTLVLEVAGVTVRIEGKSDD